MTTPRNESVPGSPEQIVTDRIRRNIRYWRIERRLTVRQLAVQIGMGSHSGIVDMETGRRTVTSEQLTALADALHVPVAAFYEEPPAHFTGELESSL